GGQRRVGAIHDAYQRSGHECRVLEAWSPTIYGDGATERLIPMSWQAERQIATAGHTSDLEGGNILFRDPVARQKTIEIWRAFAPDVVQLEHPFAWASVRELLAVGQVPPAQIVYSSQNVEWPMKRALHPQYLELAAAQRAADDVEAIERDLVKHADL